MIKNSRLIFVSHEMKKFMEANNITSFDALINIKISQLVSMPNFPYRLLNEWVMLRDQFNFFCEN